MDGGGEEERKRNDTTDQTNHRAGWTREQLLLFSRRDSNKTKALKISPESFKIKDRHEENGRAR